MMGFGKSLTVRYTNAKYPQQIYSCKTYNAFGKNHCTQHRIDYDTLYNHVLRKIRECARAALA
ncbi:zinc ribbon domain-containing protein [Enterococcus cecorum]